MNTQSTLSHTSQVPYATLSASQLRQARYIFSDLQSLDAFHYLLNEKGEVVGRVPCSTR